MTVLEIGLQEIEDLAVGATILGAGGGGDPYIGMLLAKKWKLQKLTGWKQALISLA